MESLTSGTLAGTGSFRCEHCGYVVTLAAADELPACPGCRGDSFVRASLFAGGRFHRRAGESPSAADRKALIAAARGEVTEPGEYLAYEDAGRVRVVDLAKEWTRVGRSLAADVRFDDPTVSRRHALIVRQPDGVRVLDDRSLNGVFVNGERVEWRALADGDEIVVGRYHLLYLHLTAEALAEPAPAPVEDLDFEISG
jgi:pSer/pThr/pTyr-binding forkhead associated (FHA) protein